MAACTLDLNHPFFVASKGRLQGDPDIEEALKDLQEKVEREHTSCGRVVQQFYGNAKFTHLHGKIWKYDWGKSSANGRKSWRIVVVVPDPETIPYRLIGATIYPKSGIDQLPLKELAAAFAAVTKNPIAPDQSHETSSGEFHRVPNGDGQTRSICMLCMEPVAISAEGSHLDEGESSHRCDLAAESK